jgi:hypothetical protein
VGPTVRGSVMSGSLRGSVGGERKGGRLQRKGAPVGKTYDQDTDRVREAMAGRRGGGEDDAKTAEEQGATAAGVGRPDPTARGFEAEGSGLTKEEKAKTGAAGSSMLQEAREDEVRFKLLEQAEVDVMIATHHGLLCKLRDVHTLAVYSCDFAKDGKHLASCSHDSTVVIWDVEKLQIRRRYNGHIGPVYDVKFCPLGTNERLATAGADATVKLWDKRKAKVVFSFDGQFPGAIHCLAWARDGKHLAAGGDEGTVLVWDVETAEMCASDPSLTMDAITDFRLVPQPHFLDGHLGPVRSIAFTSDCKHIVSGGEDGIVRLWRLQRNEERVIRKMVGHVGGVHCVAMNPDTTLCASSGSDGTIRVWSVRSGACLRVMTGHVGPAYSVAFSPEANGRRIVSGGHDHNIVIWETGSGTVIQKMELVHHSYVMGLAYREDGLVFASAGGDRTIGVWRALPQSLAEQCVALSESCVGLCMALPSLGRRLFECLADSVASMDADSAPPAEAAAPGPASKD